MLQKLYIFLFILFCSACRETPSDIQLKIEIQDAAIDALYLTDGYDWEKPITTAKNKNGLFTFQLSKKHLKGTLYSLSYKNDEDKLKKLNFYNHVLSSDSQKYVLDAFLIDSTFIAITPSKQLEGYYTIKAGIETAAFFKTQMMNFGYLEADLTKRTEQLQKYISIANSYPGSVYLLQKINENKSTLKKTELIALLSRFNSNATNNSIYKVLKTYAESKNDNPVFENYKFETNSGIATDIYSSSAKVNVIVFWASWCAPCRQEIPGLKKLAAKYKPNELNIVSISIDDSRKSWLNAVAAEQMSWPQLIIPQTSMQQIKEQFEIGAIPYTLFLDSNGKLITRFIGNDENSASQYE